MATKHHINVFAPICCLEEQYEYNERTNQVESKSTKDKSPQIIDALEKRENIVSTTVAKPTVVKEEKENIESGTKLVVTPSSEIIDALEKQENIVPTTVTKPTTV